MSVTSNNGPIRRLNKDNSNRSLYSENSHNSDDVNSPKYKPSAKMDEPISKKISNLPGLSNQMARTPEKQKQKGSPDRVPLIPHFKQTDQYGDHKKHSPSGPGIKFNPHQQMNTIAVSNNVESGRMRTPYEMDRNNPYRITGMSGISGIQNAANDRSRMLRSSQGGRWFRSQSLMQDKQKRSSEYFIKNFHRNGSKYTEQVQQFLKFFASIQKNISSHPAFNHKISLYDSLEQMKNKMESFLQTKIDLSNLSIDRPDVEWGQNQLIKFYQNYQQILVRRPQVPKDQQNNPAYTQTVLKKYKNCSYFGPIKDGKKNGFGFLHYFSGRFFEGLFSGDFKVQGFEMDDSELYIGTYHKNQRHGKGILKTNEYLLSGLFTNGQFKVPENDSLDQNQQKIMRKTGINQPVFGSNQKDSKHQGINRDGFKIAFSKVIFYHGPSIIIEKNNNGDIYIGQVNEDQEKQGQGLEIFANGDIYIGKYEQGVPEGYGEYYWDSGAFYRGAFLSGMRHGKGVWMMVNGDRYQGDYLNDKKNGRGVYIWKTGDRYEGEFQNDYRHGYGEMNWRDGTSYKGNWSNGIETNKIFKLEGDNHHMHSKSPQIPKSRVLPTVTKNSFKTIQPKKRVGGNSLNVSLNKSYNKAKNDGKNGNSRYSEYQRVQSSKVSNQRVPLQKLKAMLNPSNSVN